MERTKRPFFGSIAKFFFFILILFIGLFFILLILLGNTYKNFSSAYKLGLEGKSKLTTAVSQVKNQEWDAALKSSGAAQQDFNLVLENLNDSRTNIIIKNSRFFQNQVSDLEYLFKATQILSLSLERSIPLAQELSRISSGAAGGNFINLPDNEKARFLQLIYESEPEFNGLKANLELALLNINKIHQIGIMWPIYGQITEYKNQLQEATILLTKLSPLTRLLPALGGYPTESNFLVLLQNNDELRPTGGFIGVYGLAKTKNGELISLATDDSYHIDMPAVDKWKKEAPLPITKYLGVSNWYFRDSNWVPDWPLAAQKINEIYTGESLAIGQESPNFSGVIALNPDLISDLIRLVGPINIKGENYTPENFQELLQFNVEISYKDRSISSWDRKDIVNELLDELKFRLFNLPAKDWGELLKIVDNNISEKNIQIYFFNENLESLVKELNAGGELKAAPSDYLMVVDANLAAFKSDLVVKKKIDYLVSQRSGVTSASLTLGYRHEGDFNWRTTRYRSYTRVYVPLGSKLVSSSGLDQNTVDWTSLDDPILNKTIFGFFFTVEPGTERDIVINYTLPENINNQISNNNYELLVQKQSGRRTQELKVTLNPQKDNSKTWTRDLNTDQVFK